MTIASTDSGAGTTEPLATIESPGALVHLFELGEMQNQLYLIEDRETQCAAVVDPAWEPEVLLDWAAARQCRITDVLLTHSHADHTNGLWTVLEAAPARVHLHAADADYWSDWPESLVTHTGEGEIAVGALRVGLIPTPGHSPGSVCYALDDLLITGDTLFVYGCGRCDLPGSNPAQMYTTLKGIMERFPLQTRILPGHHYAHPLTSTLAEQRRGNPFLHFDNLDDFVEFRREHSRHRLPPYSPVLPGEAAW